VEGEGVDVDEGIRDVGVELVVLDHTEVSAWLVLEARLVVEVEGCLDDRISAVDAGVVEPVVALFVGLAADDPDELEDGVVEVELHADLGGRCGDGVVLQLDDECLERHGGELGALHGVEVDVGGLEGGGEVGVGKTACGCAVLDLDVRS